MSRLIVQSVLQYFTVVCIVSADFWDVINNGDVVVGQTFINGKRVVMNYGGGNSKPVLYETKPLTDANIKKITSKMSSTNVSVFGCEKDHKVEIYASSNDGKEITKEEIKKRIERYYDVKVEANKTTGELVLSVKMKPGVSNINFGDGLSFRLKAYVPNKEISTDMESSSGNISLNTLTGEAHTFSASSGNYKTDSVTGEMSGSTSSGDISIRQNETKSSIHVTASSGNIDVTETGCTVRAQTSSGNITITNNNSGKEVDASASSGNVRVSHTTGPVSVGTTSGNIKVFNNTSGNDVDVHASSGDITVENCTGKLSVRTTSGNISVENVKSKGNITLNSSSGTVNIDDSSAKDLNARASSGNIKVTGFQGPVTANTSSGNVRTNNVSGEVSASASSGDLKLNGISGSLKASTSSGSLSAKMKKVTGNVSLRSNSEIELDIPTGKYDLDISSGRYSNVSVLGLAKFEGTKDKKRITGKVDGGGVRIFASGKDGVDLNFN